VIGWAATAALGSLCGPLCCVCEFFATPPSKSGDRGREPRGGNPAGDEGSGEARGARGGDVKKEFPGKTLVDLGITKHQSFRWHRLNGLVREEFKGARLGGGPTPVWK